MIYYSHQKSHVCRPDCFLDTKRNRRECGVVRIASGVTIAEPFFKGPATQITQSLFMRIIIMKQVFMPLDRPMMLMMVPTHHLRTPTVALRRTSCLLRNDMSQAKSKGCRCIEIGFALRLWLGYVIHSVNFGGRAILPSRAYISSLVVATFASPCIYSCYKTPQFTPLFWKELVTYNANRNKRIYHSNGTRSPRQDGRSHQGGSEHQQHNGGY